MPLETENASLKAGIGFAWPATLAFATIVGSLAIACMMPFVALAVMTAATMPLRRAIATMTAIWFANQLLGFTVLGFPWTAYAFGWGGALGAASIMSVVVARHLVAGTNDLVVARLTAAFAVTFATYEALLFGFATIVGGRDMFTPGIVAQIAVNDALWFAGLLALRIALSSTAPRWFGPKPALRFA